MDAQNPFQPPTATLHDSDTQIGSTRLYSLAAVGWATLLGSPLAGAFIIMKNLRSLGRTAEVAQVWMMASGAFVVLLGLGMVLPDNLSTTGITVAQVMGMYFYAKTLFEVSVRQHRERGWAFHSNWRAAGVGLLFLLGLLVVMVPLAMLFMPA